MVFNDAEVNLSGVIGHHNHMLIWMEQAMVARGLLIPNLNIYSTRGTVNLTGGYSDAEVKQVVITVRKMRRCNEYGVMAVLCINRNESFVISDVIKNSSKLHARF